MKINLSTEYAIQILLFTASHPTRLVKIKEFAEKYSISSNPVMRIVHLLQKNGYIYTVRGRKGGFRLAKSAENISLGEIIMLFENMVYLKKEEIDGHQNSPMHQILDQAYIVFFIFLQSITLRDMMDLNNK